MRAWWHRRNRRPGGCPQLADLSCQVETPLRVFLYSRSRDELPPLQAGRSPAVHRMRAGAGTAPPTSRVQLADACCAQPPGQDHRGLGRMLDGYRVGCWSDAGGGLSQTVPTK